MFNVSIEAGVRVIVGGILVAMEVAATVLVGNSVMIGVGVDVSISVVGLYWSKKILDLVSLSVRVASRCRGWCGLLGAGMAFTEPP